VAKVGDEVFVKVIDIDLERRRISLSLKQANEGVDPNSEDFDASLYMSITLTKASSPTLTTCSGRST